MTRHEMLGAINPRHVWASLLAALLACLAVPSAASAIRVAYVSNGLGGSQNISTLRINANGSLTALAGSPVATGGTTIEGLAITPDAKRLYLAAFGTGDVRGWNVGATGGLTTVPTFAFATGSTPLGVSPSPLGTHVFVWNHGNAIGSWKVNSSGSLTQVPGSPFPAATGHTNPFAGSVSPSGQYLYVPFENTSPGGGSPDRLGVYAIAPGGALANIQKVDTGNNPFGSSITPDGKYLYVSNPEADPGFAEGSISAFRVKSNGTLGGVPGSKFAVAPGNHPLNMVITPDGKYLYVATRVTNTVNAYKINANGSLTGVPGSPFATGGMNGKGLALTPDGKRLYVSNQVSNNVSVLNVASNGSLSAIPGSPFPTGGTSPDLESIVITPNQAPTATFTATVKEAGKESSFDGSASTDSDGTVVKYAWDFGDGNTSTTTTPQTTHTYTNPGTFNVTLTVTDNEGCSIELIFTGKATLCNGSLNAKAAGTATVPAPKPNTDAGKWTGGKPIGGRGVPPGAPRCFGKRATIVGTGGKDKLKGTSKPDVIVGLGGNDSIDGRGGDDLICGGDGNDTVRGGKGNDRLSGGKGRDTLLGGSGRDRLSGGPAKDKLRGGSGRDVEKQ